MKNYNGKCLRAACLLTVAVAFSSCGKVNGGSDVIVNEPEQTITLAVANSGDNFLATRSARSLYSSEAAQNIEKVKVVIYRLGDLPTGVTTNADLTEAVMSGFTPYGTQTIVAQKLFSDWMNNGVSNAYSDRSYGNGRQASWTLSTADQITTEGVYMAYAVGYNDSEYAAYTSFDALAKENTFSFPLSVAQNTVPGTEVAPKVYEVFAGSAPFVVTKKAVVEGGSEYSYQFNVSLTLHRQVAGTIGYFTNIPVKGNADHADKVGAKLRLVASGRSASAAFAAFNSEYTGAPGTTTDNVKYVVNGYGAAAKATADVAKFYGSTTSDAYTVYEVALSDWFKGTTGTTVGMDINNDGMLNEGDVESSGTATWVNPYDASNTKPGVKKGTVLGSSFLFPFAMDSSKPTFQLQLLDATGEIIRYWNIRLQTSTSTDSQINQEASLVDANGTVTTNTVKENYVNYSILRNHLYNIGTRNAGDGGGTDTGTDDKAQPLNNETLILRVNDNWEMIHEMEID